MNKPFTILDHPSDLGIEAWGESLSDAFRNAAIGLMSIIVDLESVEPKAERQISVSGSDVQQLLVRWLSEILFLYDGERFIGREFLVHNFTGSTIDAVVKGELLVEGKHRMKLDVKAVTYHQLSVDNRPHDAHVRVYLDI